MCLIVIVFYFLFFIIIIIIIIFLEVPCWDSHLRIFLWEPSNFGRICGRSLFVWRTKTKIKDIEFGMDRFVSN